MLIAALLPASGFVGAVGLPLDIWGMPLERKLRTIAEHPLGWRAVNTWFVVALFTVIGLLHSWWRRATRPVGNRELDRLTG